MSKAKEVVTLGQTPAPSAQINQLVTDYLTHARLVFSHQAMWDQAYTSPLVADPYYLGWFPYNPLKSLYDFLRLHVHVNIPLPAVGALQYSLDSGTNWNALPAGVASGLALSGILATTGNHNYYDIDLTGISTFQHIGVRLDLAVGGLTHWEINVIGYLWNSGDTPF